MEIGLVWAANVMAKRSRKTKKKAAKTKPTTLRAPSPPTSADADLGSLPGWRVVTREQLAVLMGVHPDTVTDNVRRGMPIVRRGGHGQEGAYDAVACLDWQRSQLGKNAKDNAHTRLLDFQGQIKELELELKRGGIVPRDQVVKDGQAFAKGLSAMIRALPRRLVQAGVIPSEQEGAAAEVCRDLLLEISSWQTRADAEKADEVA